MAKFFIGQGTQKTATAAAFSGLPKAEVFRQSQSFSLFGLWLQPLKFYSEYSAFSLS
jgi:hypothetical protein